MVFCNTIPSCDWTAHYIQSNGIPVTKLHAGFSAAVKHSYCRAENLQIDKKCQEKILMFFFFFSDIEMEIQDVVVHVRAFF